MRRAISPANLRQMWRIGVEVALFDVREEGAFGRGHPFWAVSLPVSEIEARLADLVPRLTVPIVVYDDGEGYAERAYDRITALGYRDIAILTGGLTSYAHQGEIFHGVNVPASAFSELVAAKYRLPLIPAEEIRQRHADGHDIRLVQCRTVEPVSRRSNGPALHVLDGTIFARVHALPRASDTLIVIAGADRPLSILVARGLIVTGLTNPVAVVVDSMDTRPATSSHSRKSLRRLESARLPDVSEAPKQVTREIMARVNARTIDSATLERFLAEEEQRTLYLLDLRSPADYAESHPHGFTNAPMPALLRCPETWIAVRGARVILHDPLGISAAIVTDWLCQMGYDAYRLAEGAIRDAAREVRSAEDEVRVTDDTITPKALHRIRSQVTILDLARSPIYRERHIVGSLLASGPRLAEQIANLTGDGPVVLTSPNGIVAEANLAEARRLTQRCVKALIGGTEAYAAAGYRLETGEGRVIDPPDDIAVSCTNDTIGASHSTTEVPSCPQLILQVATDGIANFRITD